MKNYITIIVIWTENRRFLDLIACMNEKEVACYI